MGGQTANRKEHHNGSRDSSKRSSSSSSNNQHVLDYGFYDTIMCGSIDGSATSSSNNGADSPHDRALVRAQHARYVPNKAVVGRAECTLFVGRLSYETHESELRRRFERFGKIVSVRLVRDLVTGFSRGYAFVEFKHRADASQAHKDSSDMVIDGRDVVVEYELERRLKGWKPRRFGGGLGGFKESGQLRFGGRAKPFVIFVRSKQQTSTASSSYK